jgi:hypothetical protein
MDDKKSERDERLAKALRENLKRRKVGTRDLVSAPLSEDGDRSPRRP